MPTIIDTLVTRLTLDSRQYNTAARESTREADNLEKKSKSLTGAISSLMAAFGGVYAIKQFVLNLTDANAQIERLSKNMGISANTLSAWGNAAELAGGSAQGLQSTMDMLSKAQTELQFTGQSSLIPYFSALGLSMTDTSGKAKPLDSLLLDLAGSLEKVQATQGRATAYNLAASMGIDPGTINLLLKGRNEVERTIKQQKAQYAISQQQAEQSAKLKEKIVEVSQTFTALGNTILTAASPALEKVVDLMKQFGDWVRENKDFTQGFLSILAVGFAAVAAAAIPISATVATVTALSAAIAGLYDDFQTWKKGGESLIDWDKWKIGIDLAEQGIKGLKNIIEDLFYRAIAGTDMLVAVFQRDWKRAKFAAGELISGNNKKIIEQPTVMADAQKERQKALEQQKGGTTTATGGVIPGSAAAKAAPATQGQPAQAGQTVNSTGTGKGAMSQDDVVKYLVSKGWTKEQAVGIAANLKRESNFDPTAVGDSGKAYGVAQWHPDRQAEFKKQYNKDIKGSTAQEQLDFVDYELRKGKEKSAGDKLQKAKTAGEAAGIVSKYYERPKEVDAEAAKRAAEAEKIMAGTSAQPAQKIAAAPVVVAPEAKKEAPKKEEAKAPVQQYAEKAKATLGEDPSQGGRYEYKDIGGGDLQVTDNETGLIELASEEQKKAYNNQEREKYKREFARANDPNTYKTGGIANAGQAAMGASAGSVAMAPANQPASSESNVTNTIGEIKVTTNATDAKGIAADIGKAMDYTLTSQANKGLR